MEDTLIICIGNGKIAGDSIGPEVGSLINKSKILKNTKIIGTKSNPVDYEKLYTINKTMLYKNKAKTILIDSALGNSNNIGKVIITNKKSKIANCINQGIEVEADFIIRGIVGKNHQNVYKNKEELNMVDTKLMRQVVNKIIEVLMFIV